MFRIDERLNRWKPLVIRAWVEELHTHGGDNYRARPVEELYQTVSGAYDANFHVLVNNDLSHVNSFIDRITRLRLEAGFKLSEVQKAFESYRRLVIPLAAQELEREAFLELIRRVDDCLAYTIHRFSDHFQAMHENQIMANNRQLEQLVKTRTAALRASELKYRTLVEEITDGYFVVQDALIVFANQAYGRMHGYDPGEVVGMEFKAFVAPESREKVWRKYERSLRAKGTPRSFEYLRLTRNGQRRPTEILAKNTTYGNRLSSIGICRDITERVRMEERVREAERMAYVGQVTTSLSHEIRNPLSAIKLNLQILDKKLDLTGNDQRRMAISLTQVVRLDRILTELLEFARPLSLDLKKVDLPHLLGGCLDLLDPKFREAQIKVCSQFEAGPPELIADPEKLEQAFINLLLNALEAGTTGGTVRVKARKVDTPAGAAMEIVVADNGAGVIQENLTRMFEPFFTTKSKGTGLGLTNVKRIIEAHHGTVEAGIVPSGGTSFRITLPFGRMHGQDFSH